MQKATAVALLAFCFLASGFVSGCSREEPIPDRTKKLYSQHDEELVIRDFFDDRRGGFFLDVGSYHWEQLSTTYFLEKHLGWSGIAIDAQDKFADGYTKNRPKTKFFSYAVSDKSGETLTLHVAMGATSVDPDWHRQFPNPPDHELRKIDVTTITLNDLLAQNNVGKIDFLSIDIEGAELLALAGFDIEKYRPELVCIEATPKHREQISAYFQQHGYERIDDKRDFVNWYFTPKKKS